MSRQAVRWWMMGLGCVTVMSLGCVLNGEETNNFPQPNNTDASGTTPGWSAVQSPCGGDVIGLWFDDARKGYAGCGTNGEGKGLFVSTDGGATWAGERDFEQVRVNDIRRAPDGKLYGAGWHTLDGWSAFLIEEGDRLKPSGLFEPGTNAFSKVAQGQNIAMTSGGAALVDSLTGATFAHRPDAGSMFTEYGAIEEAVLDDESAGVHQLARVVAVGEGFWATGGIISDPAMIFLPSKRAEATYHMQAIRLQTGNNKGDLDDLHVWSPTRAITVGYDQGTQYPLVYLLDGDPYTADNWKAIDLADSGIEYKGGIEDISVRGERIVAVGEKVPTSQGGFVLTSDDGGKTWRDITPTIQDKRPGSLKRAWLFDDGSLLVAGAGAAYRYDP